MILTEEQRDALRTIIIFAEGYNFRYEEIASEVYEKVAVLRAMLMEARQAMIDSSEQIGEPNKLVAGFDLPGALAEIERLRADAEQHEQVIEARSEVINQQATRIGELEKWLKKERSARLLEQSSSIRLAYLVENKIDFDDFFDGKALEHLQAEGKIGNGNHIVETNQMVPPNGKVWQITEERKAAIDKGMLVLAWVNSINPELEPDVCLEVLQAMLEEIKS